MKTYNKNTALVLCLFGGWFGLHYFYTKRVGIGILYIFTFGFFCFGWFIDIYRILANKFYVVPFSVSPDTSEKDYWYFVDNFEKQVDKIVRRYEDACTAAESSCTDPELSSYHNLDKRIELIQNAIFIYDELDLFCTSKAGGIEYLSKEYPHFSNENHFDYSFLDEEDFSSSDFENSCYLKFLLSQYLDNYALYSDKLKSM